MKFADSEIFVCIPALTIALVAMNTNVEGVKVTYFVLAMRHHELIESVDVLEMAYWHNTFIWLAPHGQAQSIAIDSIKSHDLINGMGSVGANHWIEAWLL